MDRASFPWAIGELHDGGYVVGTGFMASTSEGVTTLHPARTFPDSSEVRILTLYTRRDGSY